MQVWLVKGKRLVNSVYRRLLHASPDRVSDPRTGGWSRIGQGQFVPGKREKSFLVDTPPVWERTALKVIHKDFICLTHRVPAEIGKASLHGRLCFLPEFLLRDWWTRIWEHPDE